MILIFVVTCVFYNICPIGEFVCSLSDDDLYPGV